MDTTDGWDVEVAFLPRACKYEQLVDVLHGFVDWRKEAGRRESCFAREVLLRLLMLRRCRV